MVTIHVDPGRKAQHASCFGLPRLPRPPHPRDAAASPLCLPPPPCAGSGTHRPHADSAPGTTTRTTARPSWPTGRTENAIGPSSPRPLMPPHGTRCRPPTPQLPAAAPRPLASAQPGPPRRCWPLVGSVGVGLHCHRCRSCCWWRCWRCCCGQTSKGPLLEVSTTSPVMAPLRRPHEIA